MKRLLAGVAFGALLFASSANATTHILTLTGDMSAFSSDSFVFDGRLYETGVLALSGFTPFILEDGDTVEATVTITGGAFSLPLRDEMFFGFNLSDILGGAQPEGAQTNGTLAFDGGASVPAGCSNCTSQILGLSSTPLSFTSLFASATYSVPEPYAVNSVSVSYQVSGAVPEPASWALLITGFGGAGAMLRRRRIKDTFVAA
ncbi:MAG: PEPxxWA-CTERM sorting domain-containing protein [Alphaproteobacteria bacterium]|nr:PEPxxWA-CTERM sorting domain-containing protein [Alphaproteobacteria bacterium]MBU1516954.1 PEPxxWA-CTERM sorting domain-containing protein [Alphaproteobacteria bacterium]MBU2095842.1 PEPxxWA-CTERM sorting domain-containing protein [Alphaproteobacteria bacterium]MBU2152021.1 PEPxxWA-CTERM sorting domain-containing protein [Alphaproteobacteria bacterium]MBU2309542.1 PEPxxWA-CTERM sorting domain-containing protein [Alphaproteobacteria bacterium]